MRYLPALAVIALSLGSTHAWEWRGGDDNGGSDSSGSSGSSGFGSGSSGSGFGPGSAGFSIPFGGDFENAERIMIAHGVLASLAFVIFFPFGAISIRLFSFSGFLWFHAIVQALAYLVYIAAFGLGIYMAAQIRRLDEAHPIIGIVLFVLIFFQPFLGYIHHRLFKKYKRRTFWSYAHIWLGRIIITLGIVNGGLGLELANNTRKGEIAYGVVAGVVWVVYVISIFVGESKRRRDRKVAIRAEAEPKRSDSDSNDFNVPGRYA
ncbi:hypothetical protein AUEXF2481DRAFT_39342 [Aureobasidium subglaciale EXF-2481]|uniref:Cytochrome b561 domain-containing protein n=1 Tax=Aureobasidium subglaciale (strain EXF-2481) TaxID=1043005 RepID=A0A074YQA3_AURSE|nr:uncharacterized protein AUEXF2481DRAFT_39342 [Aureobasidium subglaciale EXF-2481]KAI5202678.1 hypothetical protein E4T38_05445 [Aureobasidium subglaciale]KAI5221536.1 hypothetical protein E4T40_05421 [Aureobasidium subglaciale]KAI5225564.1 hypothetical protein E4T41_05197 [Aureobasidium subglaciale]KAI5261498.1 hypothetical protein E4T46_05132 [Aureobasidium subglaciale]KEQ96247.1 hypothetical protein AUEXF2481DRAFT_39342 [Aureobasidium subglaciale EXF-2481]